MEDKPNPRKRKPKDQPSANPGEREARRRALECGLIAGQEEERRRLARELHDGLNQKLTVIAIELAELARNKTLSPDICERLRRIENRVAGVIDEARRMSHRLHPTIVENLGLRASLEGLCDEFSLATGIDTRFENSGLPQSIPHDISLALYRVAQESLQNVAKHASATVITLSLAGSAGKITLSVRDNGRGCDTEKLSRKAGLGILSMTERVSAIQGTLNIAGSPGRGVCVVAEIPLPED